MLENSGVFIAIERQVLHAGAQRAALASACAIAFAFSANYTNHAPLVAALVREFNFNQTLAGLLTTGIFVTHAAMQIPGGHLVDRLGSRRILTCALAWVAVGNFAIAFSTAYWQLLGWKTFTGMGTGTCFVAGARWMARCFSDHRDSSSRRVGSLDRRGPIRPIGRASARAFPKLTRGAAALAAGLDANGFIRTRHCGGRLDCHAAWQRISNTRL